MQFQFVYFLDQQHLYYISEYLGKVTSSGRLKPAKMSLTALLRSPLIVLQPLGRQTLPSTVWLEIHFSLSSDLHLFFFFFG